MKDMKSIIGRIILAFIAFIAIITIYGLYGETGEDKRKIRLEQERMVEYTVQNYEDIKKIEFKSFKQNESTRTWTSHAIINDDIHITYDINDLSGESEIGMVFHISASNGKELKKKNNIENNGSTDTVEVHYLEK
ncbi:hypothetical protein [Gemella sanguinis]|uniref:hypothetical protein n=1 Tax=Gemella sanguinis TaxID=84135 RepID=UPI0026F12B3D|nr:hypothetical protein [Gemella sanguinis]